ncbi:Uncharacterised protein (plasmid) [Tsukamurella tyrosinosolvens]|uniref:Uncharacterized protein n=1 Tax=Tsukamurella tyrosinosolvens TaxID=57704 RepID=A0A1H4I6X9_TSUTY|nr:hypothetical protein SAMN04489793_0040 [Tsukamurella tyrosinosolvens]VEH95847.1 Uncharacterised protein [Tsukamurella tyrosinosolvens]
MTIDWPFLVWNNFMLLLIWLAPRWPRLRLVLGGTRTRQRPASRSPMDQGR